MEEREQLLKICTYGTGDPAQFVSILSRVLAYDAEMPKKLAIKIGLPDPIFIGWSKGISIPPTSGLRRFVLSLCAELLALVAIGVLN